MSKLNSSRLRVFFVGATLVLCGYAVGSLTNAALAAAGDAPGRDLGSISDSLERMTTTLKEISRNVDNRSERPTPVACECRCK